MATDEPPFSTPETATYLVSASLRQRLDLIHHLIGFGRQIIVVRGEPGSGRSRLIATVCDEANSDWLVIEIGGQGVDNPSHLLDVLLDALEPGAGERPHSAEDREARVCRQLAEMHSEHRVAVLLVDDSDAFDAEVNALLFRLAYTDNGVGELRVVLSCSADTPYLENLQAQSPQATLLHVVEIPALSEAEITSLAERFGTHQHALDAYAIAALAERSRGNPGRLLEILTNASVPAVEHHASAAALEPERAPASAPGAARMKRVAGVAVVVLAAVGLAALTLVNREVNRERGKVPEPGIELSLREIPKASAPPVGAPTLVVDDEPPSPSSASSPAAPLEPDLDLVTPAPAIEGAADSAALAPQLATQVRPEFTSDSSSQSPAAITDRTSASAASEQAPPPKATSEPVIAEAAPPPKAASGASSPADISKTTSSKPAYTSKWVLTQNDNSYVIQLFGVRDRRAAERFIASARLSEKAAVFDLVHESAPWYVVALGHYRDRAAARAAIAALPATLRASGPWPRSVASLRK